MSARPQQLHLMSAKRILVIDDERNLCTVIEARTSPFKVLSFP
jgi:hypothetical protein